MDYNLTEKERKIVLEITSQRDEAKNSRQKAGLSDKWLRYYRMSKNTYEPSEDDKRKYGRNLSIPEAVSQYRNTVCKIANPFLVQQGEFIYVAPRKNEDVDKAPGMEEVLREHSYKMDFAETLFEFIQSGIIYGTAVMKAGWNVVYGERETDAVDENGKPYTETYIISEHPTAEVLDLEEVHIDPKARTVQEAEYIIHEVYMSRSEIEERMNSGEFDKSKKKYLDDSKIIEMTNKNQEKRDQPGQCDTNLETTPFKFKITERWTKKNVMVLLNDTIPIRNEQNPYYDEKKNNYYPFFVWRYWNIPGEFYGLSFFANVEDFQYLMNCMFNILLDNMAISTRPPLKAPRDSFDEDEKNNLKLGPGKVFEADGQVEPLIFPSMSAEIWQALQIVRQMMFSETGSTDQMRGLPDSGGKETASANLTRQQSAQGLFDLIFRNLCRVLKEFWEFCKDNVLRFQQNPITRRIKNDKAGYEFSSIGRPDFYGDLEVIVEIDPTGTGRNLEIEQLIRLLERTAGMPFMNVREVIKRIGEKMNIKQLDKIILDETQQFKVRLAQATVEVQLQDFLPKLQAFLSSKSPEEFIQKFYALSGEQAPEGIMGEPPPQMSPDIGMPPGIPQDMWGNVNSQQDMMKAYSPANMDGLQYDLNAMQ